MRKINTGDVFKMARLLKNANVMEAVMDAYKAAKKRMRPWTPIREMRPKGRPWLKAPIRERQTKEAYG